MTWQVTKCQIYQPLLKQVPLYTNCKQTMTERIQQMLKSYFLCLHAKIHVSFCLRLKVNTEKILNFIQYSDVLNKLLSKCDTDSVCTSLHIAVFLPCNFHDWNYCIGWKTICLYCCNLIFWLWLAAVLVCWVVQYIGGLQELNT